MLVRSIEVLRVVGEVGDRRVVDWGGVGWDGVG